ncbi:LysR substrate-binding domain-containing protein [Rhizobium halophytocola]|uniref:DNA-binding transcriptional LysR family regulator n=1 Tax=Rhizobium halophytocola TaxID=735519 RepID=A0ABS4E2S5_9HYPH|nr:LysR substrate-binding domain-containing protein [Rhizobium halophytocola]MBP1852232.1 DNA-binding transcriptional LysR family regulator [Rhizobium halophytocola]
MLDKIPLEAFRVFDAAARFMNFSRAGRELNITQAAVSRRIKLLEEHLGRALFTRRGRNLALTADGEKLFQRIRAMLEYLEESIEPFLSKTSPTVSIAASGSISHLWLGHRLKNFAKQSPELTIRLMTTDSPLELAAETNDLVILYSTGEHPRWHLTLLLPEELIPVASPAYLEQRGLDPQTLTGNDIAGLDLIDYERFNAHWISYRQWFSRLASPPTRKPARPRLSFSTYAMAIAAAVDGDGVALGSVAMLAAQIERGELVPLGKETVQSGYGYYLGLPRYRTVEPHALRLHQHLLSETPA